MAISFPSNPTTNQTYTYNGTTYTFDSKRWVATTNTVSQASTNVGTANVAPSNPAQGQMWLNTDTGTISVYALGGWIAIGSIMSTINSGSITNGMLANSAVDATKLADSSVTTAKINNYAITAQKIANNTITASQLAAGAAVPTQTGQSGKYLTTDGTNASWSTITRGIVVQQQDINVAITASTVNFVGGGDIVTASGDVVTVNQLSPFLLMGA